MVSGLLLVALIVCSAFISGSEIAFFSLTSSDLDQFNHDPSRSAKTVLLLKQKPRKLLATILVLNNLINIAIVILFDYFLKRIIGQETYSSLASYVHHFVPYLFSKDALATIFEFLSTVLAATTVLLLFGEILPKIYANINNTALAKTTARPLYLLQRIFSPISTILVRSSGFLERHLTRVNLIDDATSKEEINKAIDLTVANGNLGANQNFDILKRIVGFGEVTVKEIMRSRVDMVAIDIESTYDEIKAIIRDTGYSRFPVFQDDMDNIVGMLYSKDLLIHHDSDDFDWKKVIRPEVKYVPENKKIKELIKEIQSERKHMVLVVDEFGGSSGIVTLEDIMEEVIGDIQDEFDDDEEVDYVKIDDKTYIFEGKTNLKQMCSTLNLEREFFDDYKGDSDSLAGMLLEVLGRIPKKNTEIKIHNHSFLITAVNHRRIEKVQISLP